MENVKSYRDLIVWQRAVEVAERVYKETKSYPKEETYGMTSQIRRAAVSVAANIAEGHGRNSSGEFVQFLGIAKGSLSELETLIILSSRMGLLANDTSESILKTCEEVSKMLLALRRAISK